MSETLLTVEQAAERLGITAKALYFHISVDHIPVHHLYGRILLKPKEIEAFRKVKRQRGRPKQSA